MKGTLHKTEQGWHVSHATYDMTSKRWTAGKFPVHPDDLDSEVIRWANNGSLDNNKVEFEIKYYWQEGMQQPVEVAKLIDTTKEQTNGERFDEFIRTVESYPELEGTMNLCNDIIEKRTGKMTEEEWQAAEKAQTSKTKLMTSIEWFISELEKVNYHPTEAMVMYAKKLHKQETEDAYEEGYNRAAKVIEDETQRVLKGNI